MDARCTSAARRSLRAFSLALLFALAQVVAAQTAIDSLQRAFATAREDSVRFRLLLALAGVHLDTDPGRALAYCEQARAMAPRTGRLGDVGEAEGWMGYVEEQRGHIPEALAHYEAGLREARRWKDEAGEAILLNNIAAIQMELGRADSAMAAHQRSLAIRRARHDSVGIAVSLGNIGYLHAAQGRVSEAMDDYAEALRLYEQHGDPDGVATTLHNMAGIYRDQGDLSQALALFMRELAINDSLDDGYGMASTEDNIGNVLERAGRDSEAMVHYRRALALHQRSNDPKGMGYSLRNIAGIEIKQGAGDSALVHADRSLTLSEGASDKRGVAQAMLTQALALEQLGRPGALALGQEALSMARSLGYPMLIRDAAQLLERLHRAGGRWKDALAMKDIYIAMRDSLLSDDARRSAIRQQYRYAYEKKEAVLKAEQARMESEARVALQRERNRRNMFMALGIGVFLLAVGLYSRLRFVRRSRAAIQRERDVADGLLLNILPGEVAEELKAKGHAEARLFDRATILFTDLKGFTLASERMGPQQLVEELNACFKAFDDIITARGIEKIKTIGDAYMCVGGLPDPRSSTPVDVVMAALEMQAFMRQRKAEHDRLGKPAFEMRVGIHTGPVVAGIVGVKKFQYDIWGDAVNTASRMESSGEVGRVNISEATYALVHTDPSLRFVPRGKVQAKGKGELEMYFVSRRSDGAEG